MCQWPFTRMSVMNNLSMTIALILKLFDMINTGNEENLL